MRISFVSKAKTYDVQDVTAVDATRDLVVLRIAPTNAPVLSLGDSDSVQVGDPVYAVGNHWGWRAPFLKGS